MWIGADVEPEHVARVDDNRPRGERGQHPIAEVVIAESVLHDKLRVLVREHVAGAWLELVWIGSWIVQDGGHDDTLSAQLAHQVRVEVLDGQHTQGRLRAGPVHGRSSGADQWEP